MERPPRSYRFADFELDGRTVRLTRQGQVVRLRPRILKLLRFFLEHPQRLVTKEELVVAVWDGAFVTDNAVARAVARLRSALGDDARHALFVETVHGEGYRFLAPVEPTAAAAVETTGAADEERPAATPFRIPGRRWIALAVARWCSTRGRAATSCGAARATRAAWSGSSTSRPASRVP